MSELKLMYKVNQYTDLLTKTIVKISDENECTVSREHY